VAIAVLNFNGRELLKETIESACAMDYPSKRVLVVDDGSTDGSLDLVGECFPEIQVVEMGRNTGMLNQVRNAAIQAADADFVFITDNDISFERDCLRVLMEAAAAREDAAVLIPRVMFRQEPDRIYIDRNRFHYVCASIDPNRNRRLDELGSEDGEPRRTFGCGIHLIDLRRTAGVGLFDPGYPMGWGDDGEFHHRVNLSGMSCYAVPGARVYHQAIKGAPRIYGQIHNRLRIVALTYQARSLLVLLPALLLYDLCLFGFLLLKGEQGVYLRALRDLVRARAELLEKRRRIQADRRVGDRELFTSGELYVPGVYRGSVLSRSALAVLNGILNRYWWLARRLLG
jgi:GT2 family glycosyltransferase